MNSMTKDYFHKFIPKFFDDMLLYIKIKEKHNVHLQAGLMVLKEASIGGELKEVSWARPKWSF